MSADLHHLSGLHGANLGAFQRAAAIVDASMRKPDPEDFLREMRAELEIARQLERDPATIEDADAHGAMAANKLAIAIGLQS